MMNDRPWEELNDEIRKLSEEYAKMKNKPKPFETREEREVREDQFNKDKHEKWAGFDLLGEDFEKKRDYILRLSKEVEALKVKERKKRRIREETERTSYKRERTLGTASSE